MISWARPCLSLLEISELVYKEVLEGTAGMSVLPGCSGEYGGDVRPAVIGNVSSRVHARVSRDIVGDVIHFLRVGH